MANRNKHWVFTSYDDAKPIYDEQTMSFLLYQREKCPTTGRLHWQGMFSLHHPKTFSGLKRMLPEFHLEVCRDIRKSIEYCRKEESRIENGEEHGIRPDKDWRGMPYTELWAERPEWMLRNWRAVKEYQQACKGPPARENHKLTVYYGAPGTGKSYKAYGENPEAYSKDGTIWWDGYNRHPVVIWDDFAGTVPFRDFLRWTDKYPMRAQVKGGYVDLHHSQTIITTNLMPIQWYPNMDFACIQRRINECFEFDSSFACKKIDI